VERAHFDSRKSPFKRAADVAAARDQRKPTRLIGFSMRNDVDVRGGVVAGSCGDSSEAVVVKP